MDDVDRSARRRLVGGRQGEDLADDVFPAVGAGEASGVERAAAYRPVPADLGDPDPHPEQFAPPGSTLVGLCLQVAGVFWSGGWSAVATANCRTASLSGKARGLLTCSVRCLICFHRPSASVIVR